MLAARRIRLVLLSAPSFADECEANFKKSGNPLVMTTYSSAVTMPNLSHYDAQAQMRGILVAEKMDVPTTSKAVPAGSSSGSRTRRHDPDHGHGQRGGGGTRVRCR